MKNAILFVLYLLLLSTQMLLASDRDGRTIVTQALMVAEADASTERQAAILSGMSPVYRAIAVAASCLARHDVATYGRTSGYAPSFS